VRLRVRPGARENAIGSIHDGALRVSVTAPAEHGKANDSVIALLAKALGIRKDAVAIQAGATSRTKTVVVALDPETVRKRLEENDDARA